MSIPPRLLYSRLIAQWPADPLRPHANFLKTLDARLDRDFSGDSTKIDEINKATTQVDIPQVEQSTRDPEAQWNALASLLDNAYFYKYPITTKTTEPTNNPGYYLNILQEMDEAPKRSWLGSFIHSWKGFIRWK